MSRKELSEALKALQAKDPIQYVKYEDGTLARTGIARSQVKPYLYQGNRVYVICRTSDRFDTRNILWVSAVDAKSYKGNARHLSPAA